LLPVAGARALKPLGAQYVEVMTVSYSITVYFALLGTWLAVYGVVIIVLLVRGRTPAGALRGLTPLHPGGPAPDVGAAPRRGKRPRARAAGRE
jgi:hypothetical protein